MSIYIWLIAVFYGLIETAYFGWNFTPKSEAELIADGIACILLSLAFIGSKS